MDYERFPFLVTVIYGRDADIADQDNIFERQVTCRDYTCSIDTDCYAQRCGNCEGGRCGCPPEGC